ncbi:hypothetical protein ABK040_014935 [Willaertia magna]
MKNNCSSPTTTEIPNYSNGLTPFEEVSAKLFCSVTIGDIHELKKLLNENVGIFSKIVSMRNDQGSTLVHKACANDHSHIIDYLHDLGFDINALDYLDSTPLHHACANGSVSAILQLSRYSELKKDIKDFYGNAPIHLAIKNMKYNALKVLIDNLNISVNSKKTNSKTLLHIAAQQFDLEGIEYLLKKNANLNALDESNSTPLMLAIDCYGDVMSSRRASLNACNMKTNNTQISESSSRTDMDTINMSLNSKIWLCFLKLMPKETDNNLKTLVNDKGRNYVHIAAFRNNDVFLRLLALRVEKSIYQEMIMSVDKSGLTPLHLACQQGFPEMVLLLMELMKDIEGTDVYYSHFLNIQDKEGNTPLHLAAKHLSYYKEEDEPSEVLQLSKTSIYNPSHPFLISPKSTSGSSLFSEVSSNTRNFLKKIEEEKKNLLVETIRILFSTDAVDTDIVNNEGESAYSILKEKTDYFCTAFSSRRGSNDVSPKSLCQYRRFKSDRNKEKKGELLCHSKSTETFPTTPVSIKLVASEESKSFGNLFSRRKRSISEDFR